MISVASKNHLYLVGHLGNRASRWCSRHNKQNVEGLEGGTHARRHDSDKVIDFSRRSEREPQHLTSNDLCIITRSAVALTYCTNLG